MITICYLSSVRPRLSIIDIESLFNQTKKQNDIYNISGVLIYNDGNFFQILEGEENYVNLLYAKIKGDKRHHNIIEIINSPINEKIFDGFDYGYSVISDLSQLYKLQEYLELLQFIEYKKPRLDIISKFIQTLLSIDIK
ncbi:hypothetical protein MHTCC0001_03400 [Flavobacteriaceae bacterium MHTCC 0001]